MNSFCTIITSSHLPYARALNQSLQVFNEDVQLNVLVVDEVADNLPPIPGVRLYSLDNVLAASDLGRQLYERYRSSPRDQLRWSLKPVFINHLFDEGSKKVIFTDPDTFYFSDYQFLFDALDDSKILLTPHWRGKDPNADSVNFDLQFVGGLYNAGFIGVRHDAREVMDWWGACCLYKCVKHFPLGQFVDQTYLNLMPLYFDAVRILEHRGCNVASWNQQECRRSLVGDEVSINGRWPVVFIHFTRSTIDGIARGEDKALMPLLESYISALKRFGLEGIAPNGFSKAQRGFPNGNSSSRLASAVLGKIKSLLSIRN